MKLHPDRETTQCIGETCGIDDVGTCCLALTCTQSYFKFNGDQKWGNVACNNLGGFGPDENCPEEIRYSKVTQIDGKDVDLVITADKEYRPAEVKRNAKGKGSTQFNLHTGVESDITFTFVETESGELIEFHEFFFSIIDMDNGEGEWRLGEEYFSVPDDVQYELTASTTVAMEKSGGRIKFSSTAVGTGDNNVQNVLDMTEDQRRNTVALVQRDVKAFSVRF